MKKKDDLIRKLLAAPSLNGAYAPRYGGRQGVEKRNWSFDPKATNGELRLLKRGLGKRRKKKVIERVRKPKPVKQQRPSKAACKVGDCALNDHVLFNVGKVTIDGHVHKIKQTRFGRRFYVRPVPDCRKYGRGWILGFATPVLKLSIEQQRNGAKR